jgi:CheY-like chemotaxis protein
MQETEKKNNSTQKNDKKFGICALLNVEGLDMAERCNINDDLSAFYQALDHAATAIPPSAKAIQDKNVYINKSQIESHLAKLRDWTAGLGAVDVDELFEKVARAQNRREISQKNEYIIALGTMLEKLCHDIDNCRITSEPPIYKNLTSLSAAIHVATSNEKMNILIVDDAAVILNSSLPILNTRYAAFGLLKGELVAKFLKTHFIDLFILDVEMPGIDGYALFNQIREMPLYKNTPIMFFTSHANVEYIQMAKSLGANAYIKKPIDPVILLDRVQKCLAGT